MRVIQAPAAVVAPDIQPFRSDQRQQSGAPLDARRSLSGKTSPLSIVLRSKKIRSSPKRPLRYSCSARPCPPASRRRQLTKIAGSSGVRDVSLAYARLLDSSRAWWAM
jgi:hypothetical protein